jgi:la-related protein 1
MYEDFKKYALDDSEQGYHYGIECLFRFYSYGLEAQFSKNIYKEFEEFVLKDQEAGQLYGLEKFWAYHHYHGLPENSGIKMHPKLAHLLETEYTSIDDFKAKRENQKQHQ